MHFPKVLERVDSPEQIFHGSFSLGAPVKEQIYFELLNVSAFSSPVRISKTVFLAWNFVQSLKLYYKNNFCQSTVNWVADSEEIR